MESLQNSVEGAKRQADMMEDQSLKHINLVSAVYEEQVKASVTSETVARAQVEDLLVLAKNFGDINTSESLSYLDEALSIIVLKFRPEVHVPALDHFDLLMQVFEAELSAGSCRASTFKTLMRGLPGRQGGMQEYKSLRKIVEVGQMRDKDEVMNLINTYFPESLRTHFVNVLQGKERFAEVK